ncbi:LamG-like jellyroll fold domain-containing protein [Pseudooceanicola sp. C21-150M6]|uniref:LamG-like jellyroll fold domain-containing protein n=1 Tax=Pseudooceanicola sp. C21-150M6 TaxID=3434355 RepID=UPI003D7F9908
MAIQTIIPGADFSESGIGYYGESWPPIGALKWAGMFGHAYPEDPSYDYSLRGKRATMHGLVTPLTGSYAEPDQVAWWTLPYTDEELLESGVPGSLTIAAVVKWLNNGEDGVPASSYNTSTTPGLKMEVDKAAGTMQMHTYAGGVSADTVSRAPGLSAGGWEFMASVWSPSGMALYRKGAADSAMLVSTGSYVNGSAPGTQNPRAFRVGRDWNGNVAGGCAVAGLAVYDIAANSAQIDKIYSGIKSWLAAHAGPVI